MYAYCFKYLDVSCKIWCIRILGQACNHTSESTITLLIDLEIRTKILVYINIIAFDDVVMFHILI